MAKVMLLIDDDFPLNAVGNHVYAITRSSPIVTAVSDEMAAEIALRLNRDNQSYPDATV